MMMGGGGKSTGNITFFFLFGSNFLSVFHIFFESPADSLISLVK